MRVAQTRGFAGAGLALLLLLALLVPQKPAADKADGTLTLGPPPPAAAAPVAPPARAGAPAPATPPRRVAAVRRPPAARAAAPAPRTAPKNKAQRPASPTYGLMQRGYQADAHDEGLCPAGAQSGALGLTCRGAEVRAASTGYVLRFHVCSTTTARFELRFPTEAEVEMRVLDGASGRPVWSWQPARPFRDEAHVLLSDVGTCWVWQTSWAQIDDRGRPLPDAQYELELDFLEVEDRETYSHRFSATGA